MKKILLLLVLSLSVYAKNTLPDAETFIKETAKEHNLDEEFVKNILVNAQKQQSIIDAMNRPAEKEKSGLNTDKYFLLTNASTVVLNSGKNIKTFWTKSVKIVAFLLKLS